MHQDESYSRLTPEPSRTLHFREHDARGRTTEAIGLELVPVAELMSHDVLACTPDMPLTELARSLVERGLSGAPVLDESGRPIGVVSKTDVLRELGRGGAGRLAERTAFDAMTPLVFWLHEGASTAQATALMAYEHVHLLPIVGRTGQLVGVLSAQDVLRRLARANGYVIPR